MGEVHPTCLGIYGYADLILELYSSEAEPHARSAERPFRIPVEIGADVEIDGASS